MAQNQIAFDFKLRPVPIQACLDAGIFGDFAEYKPRCGAVRLKDVAHPGPLSQPCHLLKNEQDGRWQILLTSPATVSHPIVQRIAAATGITPEWREGGDQDARWEHALFLATDELIAALLASPEHTTAEMTIAGIACGVSGGALSPDNARQALVSLGYAEPEGRSASLLTSDRVFLNLASVWWRHADTTDACDAWAAIHSVEDKWISKPRVGRSSVLTKEGLRRRGGKPAANYALRISG